METSYLKTLELDKIISRAAEGCVCKEARAMLLAIEPQCDPDEVRYALEQTDSINTLLIKNGSPRFGGVEGVSQLAARAVKGGVLSMGELLMVAGALRNFQHLTSWYGSSEHDALPTDDLFYALAPEPGLEQQISSAILAPDAMADTASRTLAELRKKIRATENSIRDRLESMVRNMDTSKYLQESVVSMRNGRYVVPVKSEYRGEVSGIIHDVSSTGATVFVEPQAVVEANARILQYRAQEAQEIERVLVAFTAQVAAIEPQFQYSYKAMLEIDILLAKARLALELKAFKPAVRTDSSFNLIRARHPLIDPQKCVPVDIALGGEYDSLIITGPNTGGKTVTLKTAGLLCAMAQCGFLIPADERSEICVFDEFLVDIGDEQSIEQSLSTFSAHMTNLISILNEVKAGDLVLIDEICAGTDPNEGAALAMAMLEHLHEQGVLTMVTTHYSELKTFAYGHEGMENASVEFDPVSLRPTYRLLMGVPGSSNAFNISRRLGLAEDIIQNAGELLNQEHVHMENVLQELDSERRRYESGSKEIEDLRRESEQLRNALAYSKSEFERRKNEMLRKAREQADEIYRRSRRESEAVLKELRSMKADFDTKRLEQAAEEARKKLNKTLSEDAPLPEGAPLSAKTAKKGLNVFVVSLGKNGIITDVNGNDVTVQVGILKMTVPAKKCLLTKAQPAHTDAAPKKRKGFSKNAAANYAHQMFIAKSGSAKQEIDLRGMTLDEAIPVVDKAIDDALIAGIGQLRLIHGKGTGALRAGLTAYLSTNRFVKKLETAALEAGGSGATVIDL